jgi:hypothetical protein
MLTYIMQFLYFSISVWKIYNLKMTKHFELYSCVYFMCFQATREWDIVIIRFLHLVGLLRWDGT